MLFIYQNFCVKNCLFMCCINHILTQQLWLIDVIDVVYKPQIFNVYQKFRTLRLSGVRKRRCLQKILGYLESFRIYQCCRLVCAISPIRGDHIRKRSQKSRTIIVCNSESYLIIKILQLPSSYFISISSMKKGKH